MKIIVAAGCLVLCSVFAGDRGLPALLQSRHDATALQAQIAALKAENAALTAYARALRSDPAAIEAVARQMLGLAKAGETVVLIKAPGPKPDPR
jgi:cell division protein FtsB